MTERNPDDVTLYTLHEDLTTGFTEMRAGFSDLTGEIRSVKATLIAGFRGLPTRESSEEMVRLLREGNQQVLHALVDGQRLFVDGQRSLSADIKALIARLDALIRGRSNGEPAA